MTDVDLSAGGLLRRSLHLLRAHPVPLLLPPVVLSLLTGGGRGGDGSVDPGIWRDPSSLDPLSVMPFYAFVAAAVAAAVVVLVVVAVVVVVIAVATGVVYTATTRALLDHLATGAAPDWKAAFLSAWPRAGRLAWTFVLACLFVLAGLIALIVPGLFVLAALLPLFAVLATEDVSGAAAIRRSWAVARGHKRQLALLVLAGVVVDLVATVTTAWIPLLGWVVSGAFAGGVSAVWLASGALLYRASAAHGAEASPPATPTAAGA